MSSTTDTPVLPAVGAPLPAFALTSTAGATVRLSEFKQRRPVLLAFLHGAGCAACREWLARLVPERARLDELDVTVLVVAPDAIEALRRTQTELDLPFTLLSDLDGSVAARYVPAGEQVQVALYAADRYGHCLARWAASDADAFPPLAKPLTEFAFAEQEDCACGLPAWECELGG